MKAFHYGRRREAGCSGLLGLARLPSATDRKRGQICMNLGPFLKHPPVQGADSTHSWEAEGARSDPHII